MGLGYWWNLNFIGPLNLTIQHHLIYVLVMIEHFSKWLELMPLSHYGSEGVTYAFVDMVFNKFKAPTKICINQSTNFYGSSKSLKKHRLIIAQFHKTILR
jgi:hypothetical protein